MVCQICENYHNENKQIIYDYPPELKKTPIELMIPVEIVQQLNPATQEIESIEYISRVKAYIIYHKCLYCISGVE
jgi:hypothetical protein